MILTTYTEEKMLASEINDALKSGDSNKIDKALSKVQGTFSSLDKATTLRNLACSENFTHMKDNVTEYDKAINEIEDLQEQSQKNLEKYRENLRKEQKAEEWDQAPVEGATNV